MVNGVDHNLERGVEVGSQIPFIALVVPVSCLGETCFFDKASNPNVSGTRPLIFVVTGLKTPERPGLTVVTVSVGE
ncbi:unnamed protein product, partial [marine sediment metagenome]